MDFVKTALEMGFSDAAVMDTTKLVFVPEYRQFCVDNLCGNYDLNPACPPGKRNSRRDERKGTSLSKNAGTSDDV